MATCGRWRKGFVLAVLIGSLAGSTGPASGQDSAGALGAPGHPGGSTGITVPPGAGDYWTPERLRDAKPMPMPTPRDVPRSGPPASPPGPSQGAEGRPPAPGGSSGIDAPRSGDYWTPERLRDAKPFPMPTPPGDRITPEPSAGRLGALVQSLTPEAARASGMRSPRGVWVASVDPESAAGRAGLRPGDVIVRYGGQPVRDARHLSTLLARTDEGRAVDLAVARDGKAQSIRVILDTLPR